jgi:hypothetical protein
MTDWMTAKQIADQRLPGLPATKRGVQLKADRENWQARETPDGQPAMRQSGNRVLYHVSLLPDAAAVKMTVPKSDPDQPSRSAVWAAYERRTDDIKAQAEARAAALQRIDDLSASGLNRTAATKMVAAEVNVATGTVYRWAALVRGIDVADWPAWLVPDAKTGRRGGQTVTDPAAYDFIKSDYLRPEQPSWESCYARLELSAGEHGWQIATSRTLWRRFKADVPDAVIVAARKGEQAVKTLTPAQRRDKTGMHALQAVNIDGHRWDVMVRWPDGKTGRPMMIAAQDVYSAKMLSWRIARDEDALTVRLMLADLFRDHGLPDTIYMDNGRAFASKAITGGTSNRFRFKVKPEEPAGLLKTLGITAKFTLPYSGQSKPIERAFRDMADHIARHPAFAGAYVGNKPDNRPDRGGNKPVDLDTFMAVVRDGINQHNAKPARRTPVCRGVDSFDDAFAASVAASPIRRATEAQLRLALLASQPITTSRKSGMVEIAGNRYWSAWMNEIRGRRVIVRFDPEALHQDAHIYGTQGDYLGTAALLEDAGFENMADARQHGIDRRKRAKLNAEMVALEKRLTPKQLTARLPDLGLPAATDPKIIRLHQPSAAPDQGQGGDFLNNLHNSIKDNSA